MAMKKDVKTPVKVKKDIKQKIIVAEGAVLIGTPLPFKVLYTEIVPNVETAEARVQELKTEYAGKSVSYFSI